MKPARRRRPHPTPLLQAILLSGASPALSIVRRNQLLEVFSDMQTGCRHSVVRVLQYAFDLSVLGSVRAMDRSSSTISGTKQDAMPSSP